tara:strand:+ start:210 stop:626 length:417 start_codon:yes stop_codon:yes gene_type:complete
MNTEDFDNLNTTRTVWTLIDSDGNVVIFKVPKKGSVMLVDAGGGISRMDKDRARRRWREYMDNGYRISNKCVDYDMVEFHKTKRKEERNRKAMKSIHASMDDYVKKIHDNDLKEMRINPKKFYKEFYKDKWDNYALEA